MTELDVLREHVRLNYTTDAREAIAWSIGEIERLRGRVAALAVLHFGPIPEGFQDLDEYLAEKQS